MGEIKNLIEDEAVDKMRELTKASSTCMFASKLDSIPIHVCPMQVQDVDDEGGVWFFSGADSAHNAHIAADARVQLIFSNYSNCEYLTVFGEASISKDVEKIHDLWNHMVKAWFPEGTADPNLTLICVRPETVHYWDTKDGKLVAMAKVLKAAVTGKVADIGVQGDLRV